MAIHFAPIGTRGNNGTTHSHLEDYMEGTSIDLYMSFGLRDLGSIDAYIDKANEILDNVIADSPIKLILVIHKDALDDIRGLAESEGRFDKIDTISDEFDDHSKVWGYYIEEPNFEDHNWSDANVSTAKGRLTKPVITMVRTAGGQNAAYPADPTTKDNPANQLTFNDYAGASNQIAGFDYPNSSSEWSNVEQIADSYRPLDYLAGNTHDKEFWFTVEVKDIGKRESTEAEIKWMTHRAIIAGAKGIFFYSFARAAAEGGKQAVENVCQQIEDKVTNDAMDTAVLDDDAELVSGTDVVFAYRKHCGDYWLLVADKHPESPGTKNFTIKCDLGNDFNDFDFLREMYDAPSTNISTTEPGNNYKQFEDSLERGEVKLYRFFI